MEMPGYTDYGKMYEMNPGAFFQAQEQLGLAQQFQKQRQEQAELTTKGMGLDTMFKQDTYNDRLRKSQLETEGLGYDVSDKGVKSRINKATEGLQLDAAQKKLVLDASKADLDMMELEGQRMAYSPDPNLRAQGEAIIKMHREFVKMREQNAFTAGENAKNRANQMALEDKRQAGQLARQRQLAEIKARAGAGDEKLTTDQLRAKYIQLAQQAQAQGDFEAAAMFQDQVRYITQMRAYERPDPLAGKPDVGAMAGVPTVPRREAPQPPATSQGPVSGILFPNGQPNPVMQSKPPVVPPGAKQVGTSGGRPVYEINGKRFIVSE